MRLWSYLDNFFLLIYHTCHYLSVLTFIECTFTSWHCFCVCNLQKNVFPLEQGLENYKRQGTLLDILGSIRWIVLTAAGSMKAA